MTGEPITILYVEDDPAHAEIAMRNFKNSRIANRIFHVTDGQQALDYLFRQGDFENPDTSPRPHLMLLDLRLPKVDGLEVMKRIKADPEFSDLPVVILTTSEAESDIIKAYSYQASSYLVKPLDFSKFNELLEAFGFYWLMWNIYPR
ncbi:MAG: two-component system response regulator [Spirochaetes bacterium GWF1_49_6]|nr:MAG: two-component system response regulator [Spirochaetes bacterium GWF1_49_6]